MKMLLDRWRQAMFLGALAVLLGAFLFGFSAAEDFQAVDALCRQSLMLEGQHVPYACQRATSPGGRLIIAQTLVMVGVAVVFGLSARKLPRRRSS